MPTISRNADRAFVKRPIGYDSLGSELWQGRCELSDRRPIIRLCSSAKWNALRNGMLPDADGTPGIQLCIRVLKFWKARLESLQFSVRPPI
jgi:hypothetical protein